ncbi:DeoR/GlpR family DNA-binding transcription regulator [Terriglobus sp. 2YAB30_2]|uniref:DeoR/GlpR family DNA-binding transcription regulator n=1 Tax=unclassified Terriglobus TaxID=2628988 RepID=UPI003F9633CC
MADERRALIMQIIDTSGRVRVQDLAQRFSTTSVTIRNDLNELQKRGLLQRSHGGALKPDSRLYESPFQDRIQSHIEEKRRIGILAASLIQDGEIVILDSGTTTGEIAKQIKNRPRLQVITNGVNIANELLGARGVHTTILGGTLRSDSASIVGRSAEDMLSQLSADKLFMGGAGCDPDFGASGADLEEAMVNRAMLRIARETILVADSSKFDKRSMSRIATFSEIHTVISDTNMPVAIQEKIRSHGCNLLLA